MTFSTITFSTMALSTMTLSTMTLSLMTFSTLTFSITIQKPTLTLAIISIITFSITIKNQHYCALRCAVIFMLNVIMLSVVAPSLACIYYLGSPFCYQETPSGGRKKIIPVGSDFESSPSPETPGSPVTPSPAKNEDEEDSQKKKAKFGLKWKSKSIFLLLTPKRDHCVDILFCFC
jgi:hypothetical protein